MLKEKEALWVGLIKHIYYDIAIFMWFKEEYRTSSKHSLWWRDIIKVGKETRTKGVGFMSLVNCKIGNGSYIPLWKGRWLKNMPLANKFPIVYIMSASRQGSV